MNAKNKIFIDNGCSLFIWCLYFIHKGAVYNNKYVKTKYRKRRKRKKAITTTIKNNNIKIQFNLSEQIYTYINTWLHMNIPRDRIQILNNLSLTYKAQDSVFSIFRF